MSSSPYREPAPPPPEIPLTDDEVAFWDRAMCAQLGRPDGDIGWAAKRADAAVQARRERFGVRGAAPTGSVAGEEP